MNINLDALDGTDSLLWSGGGQAVQGFTYSPYGGGPARSGGMQLGFNGERPDPINQTYHLGNGYRTYDPALMRFTAPDSWSPFGAGGLNAYAYCEGDPINRTDPSGHMSWQAGVGIGLGLLSILGTVLSLGMAIPAEGVMAGLLSLDAADVLAGGLGLAAGVTSIASDATQDSNPRASEILGWISFGLGLASVGAHATKMVHGKLKRRPATRLLDDSGIEMRSLISDATDGTAAGGASARRAAPMDSVLAQDADNAPGPSGSTWIPGDSTAKKPYRNPQLIRQDSEIDGGLVTRNAQGALVFDHDGTPVRDGIYNFALSHEDEFYLSRPSIIHRWNQMSMPREFSPDIEQTRWNAVNVRLAGRLQVHFNQITGFMNNNRNYPKTKTTFMASAWSLRHKGFLNENTELTYQIPGSHLQEVSW